MKSRYPQTQGTERCSSRKNLRLPEVQAKVGLGRDSVYRLARAGKFPKPIKVSERCGGWFEDELDAYLECRAAERDRDQAA
jgi:prophage regulatory protein